MAERRPTMMDPPVESLLDRVDSKFTLVTLAAKRGRQINSYFNQLGEGLGAIVPPQVTSVSRKPLSIALEEISAGKIIYHRLDGSDDDIPAAAASAAAPAPASVPAAPAAPAAVPAPSDSASPSPSPSPEAEQ
jgi:DNA-directed RNA polymerase subunit omega